MQLGCETDMQRVILYVDGFNFYYGVTAYWRDKNKRLAGLGWCDFHALVKRNFLIDAEPEVKYFTAPVYPINEIPGHKPDEHKRYHVWARAVRTIPGIRVIEGFHKGRTDKKAEAEVLNPDAPVKSRQEKQTDTNLAIEILLDANSSRPPDQLFLLSDDRDLMPVVFAILERLSNPLPVVVLLPSSGDRKKWIESYRQTAERLVSCGLSERKSFIREPRVERLDEDMLASSLLRYTLHDREGEFECLEEWRLEPAFLKRHCRNGLWRPDKSYPQHAS